MSERPPFTPKTPDRLVQGHAPVCECGIYGRDRVGRVLVHGIYGRSQRRLGKLCLVVTDLGICILVEQLCRRQSTRLFFVQRLASSGLFAGNCGLCVQVLLFQGKITNLTSRDGHVGLGEDCTAQRIVLCQLLAIADQVEAQRRRHHKADGKQHGLGPTHIPAGDAVHGFIEPEREICLDFDEGLVERLGRLAFGLVEGAVDGGGQGLGHVGEIHLADDGLQACFQSGVERECVDDLVDRIQLFINLLGCTRRPVLQLGLASDKGLYQRAREGGLGNGGGHAFLIASSVSPDEELLQDPLHGVLGAFEPANGSMVQ